MLGYEIFLKNKDEPEEKLNSSILGDKLVKKIFVFRDENRDDYHIEVDPTLPQEVGASTDEIKYKIGEKIDLLPGKKSGICARWTGNNSNKEYLVLGCALDHSTKKCIIKKINKTEIKQLDKNEKIKVKIAKKGVLAGGENIYNLYIKNCIIQEENNSQYVSAKLLRKIVENFEEYVKKKLENVELQKEKNKYFQIFILPTKGELKPEVKKESDEENRPTFEDSFWNNVSGFTDKCTKNAKFFTFDDEILTLNLKQKDAFYKSLNIGKETVERINMPECAKIKGNIKLWIFNIEDPTEEMENSKAFGVYEKIKKYYERIKSRKADLKGKSQLKILLFQENQSKKTILIDCNLTFDQLEILFKNRDYEGTNGIFEELIGKENQLTDYLWAIRKFLFLEPVRKGEMLKKMTLKLKENRTDWFLNEAKMSENEMKRFFENSEILMKILCGGEEMEMEDDEKIAYDIGKIAGRYIKIMENEKMVPSSLRKILGYAKYDENKLISVFVHVCQRINLRDLSEKSLKEIEEYIAKNNPNGKRMENPNDDYSYFFFSGVYEGMKNE